MLRITRFVIARSLVQANIKSLQRFSTTPVSPSSVLLNTSYLSELDTANIVTLLQETQVPVQTVYQKLSSFGFWNCYNAVDEFSRELLFYLSSDLGLGVATSIIVVSLGIKLLFLRPQFKSMIGSMKMKQLEPEMMAYQNKMKLAQQTRNMSLMKNAQSELSELRRRNNIHTSDMLVTLLQFPLLITWFLSLRYVLSLPEFYPMIKTEGLLWFRDLSNYDGYGFLPILSAVISYYNISNSLNLKGAVGTVPLMAQIQPYARYLPFLGMFFMFYFPSGLSLYWCCLAASQAILTAAITSPKVRQWYGISKLSTVQQKILKAIIVDRPKKLVSLDETADKPVATAETIKSSATPTKEKEQLETKKATISSSDKPTTGQRVQILRHKPKRK